MAEYFKSSESDDEDDSKDKDKKKAKGQTPRVPLGHVDVDLKSPQVHVVDLHESPKLLDKLLASPDKSENEDKSGKLLKHTEMPMDQAVHLQEQASKTGESAEDEDDDDEEEDGQTTGQKPKTGKKKQKQETAEDSPAPELTSLEELMRQVKADLALDAASESAAGGSDNEAEPASNAEQTPDVPLSAVQSENQPAASPAPEQAFAAAPTPAAVPGAGGLPPRRPTTPPAFNTPGPNRWSAPQAWNPNLAPAPVSSPNALNTPSRFAQGAERGNERSQDSLKIVAAAAVAWMLRGYFANKQARQEQKLHDKQLAGRDERIGRLEAAQSQLTEVLASHVPRSATEYSGPNPTRLEQPMQYAPEQRTAQAPMARPENMAQALPPAPEQAPRPQLQEQGAEPIALRPGEHVERNSWYSVVKDQYGREVQGAINYGEAFQQEKRQEQPPAVQQSAPGQVNGMPMPGAPIMLGYPGDPMLPSGQADASHELPPGHPLRANLDHQLQDDTRRGAAKAVSNPWLWAAVTIWLIVFFVIIFL